MAQVINQWQDTPTTGHTHSLTIMISRLQGYHVSDDGAIEKEDLFWKRIGGVVQLYAAVMQTSSGSRVSYILPP